MVSTHAIHRSAVVAQALHHQLEATPGLTSCGWATSAGDALYGKGTRPDVWIVNERLPCSGAMVLCDGLSGAQNHGRVVVLAALGREHDLERVLPLVERGASGIVDVSSSWPLLVKAVHAVADGLTWLPRQLESDLLRSMLLTRTQDDLVIRSLLRLTDQERQVLLLLAGGQSRSEVAPALHISAHTARTHVQRVIDKFGVHSLREVVAPGLRHRLRERFGVSSSGVAAER